MSACAGVQTTKKKKMIKTVIYLTAVGCTVYLILRMVKPFFKKEDPRLKDWIKEQKRKR